MHATLQHPPGTDLGLSTACLWFACGAHGRSRARLLRLEIRIASETFVAPRERGYSAYSGEHLPFTYAFYHQIAFTAGERSFCCRKASTHVHTSEKNKPLYRSHMPGTCCRCHRSASSRLIPVTSARGANPTGSELSAHAFVCKKTTPGAPMICTPSVRHLYTICTPSVHHLYTICTPYVHHLYTICTPYVQTSAR